jgi:superfamily I DNA/RNA helicase
VIRRLGAERNFIDFDDLVGLTVELLETQADVRAELCGRFRHVSVDEFQDLDEAQYRMLALLFGPDGNICAIGDPDQAIYGFRGADATCFERFAADFPAARTLSLARNYRSTGTIVTAASRLMGRPAEGIVRPMQDKVVVHAAPNERTEAEFVTATIEGILGGHDLIAANRAGAGRKQALGFADFAVLYRTDAQASALREAFDRAGIPFKKSSPEAIAGQAAVRAVLKEMDGIDAGSQSLRLDAAVEKVLRRDDAPDAASLAEAKRWLSALAGGEAPLRERVALSTEADFWDRRADRVSLTTMHAAKGLEFRVVFVVGMEEGLVPFSFGSPGEDDAEERRLFYVAMTRARDRLFLTRALERSWQGQTRPQQPSRFLAAIPDELATKTQPIARKPKPQAHQYNLF